VVGRPIDTTQTATLVTSALDMTIRNRDAQPGVVIHSDHGAKPRAHPVGVHRLRPCFRPGAIVLGPDASSNPISGNAGPPEPQGLGGGSRPETRSQFIIGTRQILVNVWHRLASHAVRFCELEACSFTDRIDKGSSSSAMSGTHQNRLADVVT
jgi:hypothetical protein